MDKSSRRWSEWIERAAVVATLLSGGCAPRRTPLALDSLQHAPPARILATQRLRAADAGTLAGLFTPLGPRLGWAEIRTSAQWRALAQLAPELAPAPPSAHGELIVLASWAGTPVDREWPIHIDNLRILDGAGLLQVHFHGGTYLPDGVVMLETIYVDGLTQVMAIDVNGALFTARPPSGP